MGRKDGHRLAENFVPEGWKQVRLGDVASIRREKEKPSDDDRRPYVGLEHIASGGILNGYAEARSAISDKTIFRKGDTLFGKLRPNLRKVVRIKFDGGCSTDILALFPRSLVDGSLLSHILRSDQLHSHAMRGIAGTKMPRTSWPHLQTFRFGIPPLHEQRAIAAVLNSIDEAIERTEAVIAATEQLRDSLLHELLTRGVPGWHTEWKDVPGLGTIPADWDVVRLGDVCSPPEYGAGAQARPFDPNLPRYIRITDLTDDGRLRENGACSADQIQVEGYELHPGDLLFARSGATVGKTYMYRPDDGPCVYAGYLIRFRANPDVVLPRYLELATHSQFYSRWVGSMYRAGAQPNINAPEYSSLRIPLPPLGEQRIIAATLDCTSDALNVAREGRDHMKSFKASAADVLLTGRLRVSEEVSH